MAYISLWMATLIMVLVGSTNGNNYDGFTREELLCQYRYVRHFNRGKFERDNYTDDRLEELSTHDVNTRAKSITQELDCNYLYNMLVFLRLISPDDYTERRLFNNVNRVCGKWDQKMLKAKASVNFGKSKKYTVNHWLFLFYLKKMELQVRGDKLEELDSAVINLHGILRRNVQEEMKTHCESHLQFDLYTEELKTVERNPKAIFELLTKVCTDLDKFKNGVDYFKGFEEYDLDRLCMTSVIDNTIVTDTLITGFGGLENGKDIVKFLRDKVKMIKNPTTPLRDFVLSIKIVHLNFFKMVRTIMLRIILTFIRNLKTLSIEQTKDLALTFQTHMNKLIRVLNLNKDDDFTKIIDPKSFGQIQSLMGFAAAKTRVIDLLKVYDQYEFLEDDGDYEKESWNETVIYTSALKNIAHRNSIKIAANERTVSPAAQNSILCAHVFVSYLENILTDVNINVIQQFDELDYDDFYVNEVVYKKNKSILNLPSNNLHIVSLSNNVD